jgi:hypothetical protein
MLNCANVSRCSSTAAAAEHAPLAAPAELELQELSMAAERTSGLDTHVVSADSSCTGTHGAAAAARVTLMARRAVAASDGFGGRLQPRLDAAGASV